MELLFCIFYVQFLFKQLTGLRMMTSLIYDVSRNSKYFLNIWSKILMIYLCAKFHCDTWTNIEDTRGRESDGIHVIKTQSN